MQAQPLLWPVEVGADNRSIVVPCLESHPEVETSPRGKIIETSTAVCAVGVREDMGYRGRVTAVGIKHLIPARLSEPLGNRVFVNLHGHAMPVIPVAEHAPVRMED